MTERLSSHESHEPLQSPERFIFYRDAFLMYGRSGRGKSSTTRLLAQALQIPKTNMYYTGKVFREHHQESGGKDFIGPIQRDDPFDRKTDKDHQDYILKAALEKKPIIIEGRLSPMHGLKAQQYAMDNNLPIPQTHTILFSMRDEKKGFDGLFKREQALQPLITYDQVRSLILQREAADLERWNALYPDFIQGQDHFDPNFRYNGKLLYDSVVYFDDFNSAQEMADELLRKFLEEKIIEEISPQTNEIPIFPNSY